MKITKYLIIVMLLLFSLDTVNAWVNIYFKKKRTVVTPDGWVAIECYSRGWKCIIIDIGSKYKPDDSFRVAETEFKSMGKTGETLRTIIDDGNSEIIILKDDDAEFKVYTE